MWWLDGRTPVMFVVLLHLIYQMDGTQQIAHCSGGFAFKVEAVNLASLEV